MDPNKLLALPPQELRQKFTRKDTILYALGTGAGIEAAAGSGLEFVYEEGLKALPTMAVVMASPGFWQREPQYEIAWQKVLHAEQSATFHRPLPVEGEIVSRFVIAEIYDKGAAKGALLYAKRTLYDADSGHLLATVVQSSFLRGDGGFGGKTVNHRVPYAVPADRPPDEVVRLATRPEQAMIYRLLGDFNPLHIDPQVARSVGFDRPILHGLCTYALAGRAAMASLCGNDPARLRRLDVRFSSPIYPGETVSFEIWKTGTGTGALRAKVAERNAVVLDNGYIEFASG
jgi:acyl dehydratase